MAVISLRKGEVVSLKKGEVVSLVKEQQGLQKVNIGLGWDPIDKTPKSLIGAIKHFFGTSSAQYDIDLDAWVLLLDKQSHTVQKVSLIYYANKLYSINGCLSVEHHGDNLTGAGDGDDEVITIQFSNLPKEVNSIVVGVTIYQAKHRNQTFGNVENVFMRIVDWADNKELVRFEEKQICANTNETTFIAGEFKLENEEWRFEALGNCMKADTIEEATKMLSNGYTY